MKVHPVCYFAFTTFRPGKPAWFFVFWFSIALLAISTCWAKPSWAQSPGDGAEVAAPEQTVDVTPKASDEGISRRVQSIFEATGWFREPRVEVREGVAFLTGTVRNADHRQWARDLAAKTAGVVAVVNNIAVEQPISWSFEPARAELLRVVEQIIAAMPLVVLAIFILPLAWILARLIAKVMRWLLISRIESPFLKDVIAWAVAFPVFLLGIYLVLQVAGLTQLALSIVGGAGVVGIVIGFAFRDIAENFLASLLLSIRRPFRREDWIRVGDKEGIVQSMNTRSTVLISIEGNHIQIPNATVFKATIENFTAASKRRGDFLIGIGYDASVAETQDVLMGLLREHEAIFAEPAPLVLIDELGASTVNIRVYYWFDGMQYSFLKLKSALLRLSKRALTDAGISMPDEAREVIFPEGIPIMPPSGSGPAEPGAATGPEILESKSQAEPKYSASEANLANESEDLQQQISPKVEEGEKDLLGDLDKA